jgi:hypothetical protein
VEEERSIEEAGGAKFSGFQSSSRGREITWLGMEIKKKDGHRLWGRGMGGGSGDKWKDGDGKRGITVPEEHTNKEFARGGGEKHQ